MGTGRAPRPGTARNDENRTYPLFPVQAGFQRLFYLPLLQRVWVDWTGLVGSQDLGWTLLMVIS
jgi:hypothetical protein